MTVKTGRELARYSPESARPSHITECAPAARSPSASVRTTWAPASTRTVTAALCFSANPSVVVSRTWLPSGEIVTGVAVGERSVLSTVTLIP